MTQEPTPAPTHWHLKKEIQVGHVVTTLIFAMTGLIYVTKMDQRIAVIESQVAAQKERDMMQDKQHSEALSLIREQMNRMDGKLDRLVERKP